MPPHPVVLARLIRVTLVALTGTAPLVVSGLAPVTPATAGLDPRLFPGSEVFRELQLTTLACSRENTASDCDRARAEAENLIEHPRLPSSCKDSLWTITQKATVGSTQSFERRRVIDKAAQEVVSLCRQRVKPTREEKKES